MKIFAVFLILCFEILMTVWIWSISIPIIAKIILLCEPYLLGFALIYGFILSCSKWDCDDIQAFEILDSIRNSKD